MAAWTFAARLRLTNEPPFNRAPRVSLSGDVFLGRMPVFITPSNTLSTFTLWGSADDDDDDSLWFEWYFEQNSAPEINGVRQIATRLPGRTYTSYYSLWTATNAALTPGSYSASLITRDRMASVTASIRFEVITDEAALDELATALQAATDEFDHATLSPYFEAAREAAAANDYASAAARLAEFQEIIYSATSLTQPERSMLYFAAQAIRLALSVQG